MKMNITKLFLMIIVSAPISMQADELDPTEIPWGNPCPTGDSTCQKNYVNPNSKRVDTSIIVANAVEDIGTLCTENKLEEKIWSIDREEYDKGLVHVELELPEKHKSLTFESSSLIYGDPLDPTLLVDLGSFATEGILYFSLEFKKTGVPISFNARYFGGFDEVENKCYYNSLEIKL